ncbi:MAG: sugar ABC transporter permease [Firmicutes bacterium]|nr:sugar ABC transporter permease [Bacillota bacterium]
MAAHSTPKWFRSLICPGYVFIMPAIIITAGLILYPLLNGLIVSLHQWNWVSSGMNYMPFIGARNYVRLVHDPYFWNSLRHTFYFALGALVIEFGLGMLGARLLNAGLRGALLFRTALMFPLMVSDIVAAVAWKMLLNPSMGPINTILAGLHLGKPNWLGNPALVVPALSIVDAWWQTGNLTLILLAGLQTIPREPMEMAKVDGANSIQLFRHLVWPHLIPFAKTAVAFRVIDLLRVFALPWGITGGGPGRASEMAQLYIYAQGMGRYLDIGYSTSLAITFAIIVGVSVLVLFGRPHGEG